MEKSRKVIKIEIDSETVSGNNDKYIKTKLKIYNNSMITNFQGKKMPKEKISWKCLSIAILDSVAKAKKKCYPQTLLEECKYEPKKIEMENLIDDDLEKVRLMTLVVNLIMMNLRNNLLKAEKVILINKNKNLIVCVSVMYY